MPAEPTDVQVRMLTDEEITRWFLKVQWRLSGLEWRAFADAVNGSPRVAVDFVNERLCGRDLSDELLLAVMRELPGHVRKAGIG
ncbi:MAG TPA: hypothetical protein VL494_13525 [Steroidobacteraceae bacterium]|jgi:hypothetical protein|nr:hypothetical protein [Steroidobacteraceae bacterium]